MEYSNTCNCGHSREQHEDDYVKDDGKGECNACTNCEAGYYEPIREGTPAVLIGTVMAQDEETCPDCGKPPHEGECLDDFIPEVIEVPDDLTAINPDIRMLTIHNAKHQEALKAACLIHQHAGNLIRKKTGCLCGQHPELGTDFEDNSPLALIHMAVEQVQSTLEMAVKLAQFDPNAVPPTFKIVEDPGFQDSSDGTAFAGASREKIKAIKMLREITGCGLAEAKESFEGGAPIVFTGKDVENHPGLANLVDMNSKLNHWGYMVVPA